MAIGSPESKGGETAERLSPEVYRARRAKARARAEDCEALGYEIKLLCRQFSGRAPHSLPISPTSHLEGDHRTLQSAFSFGMDPDYPNPDHLDARGPKDPAFDVKKNTKKLAKGTRAAIGGQIVDLPECLEPVDGAYEDGLIDYLDAKEAEEEEVEKVEEDNENVEELSDEEQCFLREAMGQLTTTIERTGYLMGRLGKSLCYRDVDGEFASGFIMLDPTNPGTLEYLKKNPPSSDFISKSLSQINNAHIHISRALRGPTDKIYVEALKKLEPYSNLAFWFQHILRELAPVARKKETPGVLSMVEPRLSRAMKILEVPLEFKDSPAALKGTEFAIPEEGAVELVRALYEMDSQLSTCVSGESAGPRIEHAYQWIARLRKMATSCLPDDHRLPSFSGPETDDGYEKRPLNQEEIALATTQMSRLLDRWNKVLVKLRKTPGDRVQTETRVLEGALDNLFREIQDFLCDFRDNHPDQLLDFPNTLKNGGENLADTYVKTLFAFLRTHVVPEFSEGKFLYLDAKTLEPLKAIIEDDDSQARTVDNVGGFQAMMRRIDMM